MQFASMSSTAATRCPRIGALSVAALLALTIVMGTEASPLRAAAREAKVPASVPAPHKSNGMTKKAGLLHVVKQQKQVKSESLVDEMNRQEKIAEAQAEAEAESEAQVEVEMQEEEAKAAKEEMEVTAVEKQQLHVVKEDPPESQGEKASEEEPKTEEPSKDEEVEKGEKASDEESKTEEPSKDGEEAEKDGEGEAEAEAEGEEEKEPRSPRQGASDADDEKSEPPPPTTPPPMPFAYMYEHPGEIAHDVELRNDPDLIPEGAKTNIDVPENEQHEVESIFMEDPSLFSHCVLVRDFVEPLRVGSALMERSSSQHDGKSQFMAPEGEKKAKRKFPDELLHLEGAIVDKADNEDNAELQVTMFGWLSSIAGEVRIIPNGALTKWSSKKKVPIAGYLCVGEGGPVLHTLPTPCLPTTLNSDGQPQGPPEEAEETTEDSAAPSPAAPVPAEKPRENKTETKRVESVNPEMLQQPTAGAPVAAVASSPAAAPGVAADEGATYDVWVGKAMLKFSSAAKGQAFCHRLAEKIANDLGDNVWDTEKIEKMTSLKDPTLDSFVQLSRQPSAAWTLGTKKLLVAVMDWEHGDYSRAPMSKQTKSPNHYKKRIFPRVKDAFKQMSYGKFDIEVTVIPDVVRYARKRSRYAVGGYPFPSLYNAAKDSLEGNVQFSSEYNFDDYDLVYVIAPQSAPTGTKGVAWVGAKGAMCNGCEELTEDFQVMVAVHELGHNLGLFHAGSKSLEYGNVFDWMGNYPGVQGLSYGVGYKLALGWLPQATVARVTEDELDSLNDEYIIKPFDMAREPQEGELVGLRITLRDSPRDLFVSYRRSAGEEAGVYLTLQEKDKPNSELVDAACHSVSQRDARLRPGWTYLDQSQKVVIYLASVDSGAARVRAYRAPTSSRKLSAIRGRPTFTDGSWKCPRTCQDSDLLVSMFGGCASLKQEGYCRGGSITMGGKKMTVAEDLCPESCGKCRDVVSGDSLLNGGCADRNIKIGRRSCYQASREGLCNAMTSLGNVGNDLCPNSCGTCPPKPLTGAASHSFRDPTPARMHGVAQAEERSPAAEDGPEEKQKEAKEEAEDAAAEEKEEEAKEQEETDKANDQGSTPSPPGDSASKDATCTDDPVWSDSDGDSCAVYAKAIAKKTMDRKEACGYNDGAAKPYCRKTCQKCEIDSSTCQDKVCVTKWHAESGRCFACSDYSAMCGLPFFAADCPRTCGSCRSSTPVTTPPLPTTPLPPTTRTTTTTTTIAPTRQPVCKDSQCVTAWQKTFGECYKCEDYAAEYCGNTEHFRASCPMSCKMCAPQQSLQVCEDNFMPHTCKRYQEFGWCTLYAHISDNCKATCGVCAAEEMLSASLRRKTQSGSAAVRPGAMLLFVFAAAVVASAFPSVGGLV